ncbi:bile acid:sodium symporter family protein [Sulfurimonas sp.]|uniref:bile acid:sodium symporter family protein n=1 Tax=Sulfurimonas sp. TaxID=2022749 RepID=UPI0025D11E89|nr:bile acid:sodium symporter family protein [Sulfurimonas sp.]
MSSYIIRFFPVLAVFLSVIAYYSPMFFIDLKSQIVPLLMLIMLLMGLTLTFNDFKNLTKYKKAILVGIILQFSVMPIAALLISNFLGLDKNLTIGMILVGSVAGGTASNVMCYIAKGNVALSISMTALSTLIGVVLTPILIKSLAGTMVDISVMAMIMSLAKIVLLPVFIGLMINHFLSSFIKKIDFLLPLISVFAIVIVIAIVVALNTKSIATLGLLLPLAIIIHNAIGLTLGYWACKALGFDKKTCRTISIEVGLQNSGLAVALAHKFFLPVAALPGVLFSIWHNISGSILAGYWSKRS